MTRPFARSLLLVAAAAVLLPYVPGLWARLRGRKSASRTVFGSGDED